MARSLIQTVNQSPQDVALNGIISLGSTLRRFGCNLRLSGNGIEANGPGYYTVDASVTVAPTAAGLVTVTLYDNGVPVTGATASATGTAAGSVSLPIVGTIRQGCCDVAHNLTVVLEAGPGVVSNISVRIVKE